MSDDPEKKPNEDPRDRFRRLLASSGDEEVDINELLDQSIPREQDPLPASDQESGDLSEKEVDNNGLSSPSPAVSLVTNESDRLDETRIMQVGEEEVTNIEIPEPEKDLTSTTITPISPLDQTPSPFPKASSSRVSMPAVDQTGMPLPRRVDEIDTDATQVSPVAYQAPYNANNRVPLRSKLQQQQPPTSGRRTQPNRNKPKPGNKFKLPDAFSRQSSMGCMIRMTVLGLFGFVILGLILGTIVLMEYYSVAATIPSVDDLRNRASQFETTRILDRNGNTLYEMLDPNAGRRTYVTLDKISPYLVAATIATEDKNFYSHPGFDPLAIVRAFLQNWQNEGEIVSGASSITQQLARNLLFSPEERVERTYRRKVREALTAVEITRRYSKDEILELYLNEIYYGNLSYGSQAAAEIYFQTTANHLTMGQAAFLAGLPQAPSVYDVYTNKEVTLLRLQQVLTLMYQASQEQGCIVVSNNQQPICVDRDNALNAYSEIQNLAFEKAEISIRYPHWVFYIQSQLEAMYDPQTIYRSGFTVFTTLDPSLQKDAQKIVKDQVDLLVDYRATNGALVAIRPNSGEILAMVGSADFDNEDISGEVNMAVSKTRQPGSTMKPITYLAAFEKGWTPATLIWDVPVDFPPSGNPDDPRPPYRPVNYSGKFVGPVLLRDALANSYNLPAVRALQFVGIYDNPTTQNKDGMIEMASRLGITTLTQPDYGLSLTLGGGEVSLLEMTGVYATIANSGLRKPPVSILKILDFKGDVVYEYQPPTGEQVIRSEHAFLISSILSDNEARAPSFGSNSILNLGFPTAAKTGTTNEFRDNWTIGYTPDIAVGVWVGNADYTPMQNTTGLTGAAPIWAEFMKTAVQALTGGSPTPFIRPAGIVDRVICSVSGTEPSQWCPNQRGEIFAADQLPLPADQDLWYKGQFDTWTGLLASPVCGDFTKDEFAINVTDPWAIKWMVESNQGKKWVEDIGFKEPLLFIPPRECRQDDPRPKLAISSPGDNQIIQTSPFDIIGLADATQDFKRFNLSYGIGDDPIEWNLMEESSQPVKVNDILYTWDLFADFPDGLPAGPVTLRLQVESTRNTMAELLVKINFMVPTNTPTTTLTPTETVTFTPTLPASATATATPVPPSTATPTKTLLPTTTPTLQNSSTPTVTLTPTVTHTQTPGP